MIKMDAYDTDSRGYNQALGLRSRFTIKTDGYDHGSPGRDQHSPMDVTNNNGYHQD